MRAKRCYSKDCAFRSARLSQLKTWRDMMIYQRNDPTPGGCPSLFDETFAAETANKPISILSAATGGDGSPACPQKSHTPVRFTLLLLLMTAGLAGWAYRHFTQPGFHSSPEAAPILSQARPRSLPAVRADRMPAPRPGDAPTHPVAGSDIAVVEVMQHTLPDSVPHAAAYSHVPADKASALSGRARSMPRVTPQASTSPRVKTPPSLKAGVRTGNKVTSLASAKDASTIKPKVAHQNVAKARSTTDSDVKLLEGILRLIKREDAQEPSAMRPTK